jgi:hypothetical protein
MAKRDRKGCFFLIAVPLTFIVILLIIFVGLFFLARGDYVEWKDDFEKDYLSTDFVDLDGNSELEISLTEKLEEFQASDEEVYFVEIDDSEFIYLLSQQLSITLPDYIDMYRGVVIYNEGSWDIYIQTKFRDNILPWTIITLSKDDIETAQLYVSELKVGPYDLDEYWLESIRKDINEGFSEALLLVNENEFSGRRFDNIELEDGVMVVKGSL